MKWKIISAAIDILLPRTCMVCGGRLISAEKHICLECLADMPLTYYWKLPHNTMSDRLNEVIQKKLEKEDSFHSEPYAQAAALFLYHSEDNYRLIPYDIKYKGNIKAGEYFGRMLGRRLKEESHWNDADMIIPVPLHWRRRFVRGYNQAEAIASGLASAMGITLRTDILIRKKRTRTQTKLDIEGKALNVADAFKVNDKVLFPDGLKHVVILDDIFTTGSTIGACFTALRAVFPPEVRISVATLGFVGGG